MCFSIVLHSLLASVSYQFAWSYSQCKFNFALRISKQNRFRVFFCLCFSRLKCPKIAISKKSLLIVLRISWVWVKKLNFLFSHSKQESEKIWKCCVYDSDFKSHGKIIVESFKRVFKNLLRSLLSFKIIFFFKQSIFWHTYHLVYEFINFPNYHELLSLALPKILDFNGNYALAK